MDTREFNIEKKDTQASEWQEACTLYIQLNESNQRINELVTQRNEILYKFLQLKDNIDIRKKKQLFLAYNKVWECRQLFQAILNCFSYETICIFSTISKFWNKEILLIFEKLERKVTLKDSEDKRRNRWFTAKEWFRALMEKHHKHTSFQHLLSCVSKFEYWSHRFQDKSHSHDIRSEWLRVALQNYSYLLTDVDHEQNTLLHLSVTTTNCLSYVRTLLEENANPNLMNFKMCSPLKLLAQRQEEETMNVHVDTAKMLLEYKAEINVSILRETARGQNCKLIQLFLERKESNPFEIDENQYDCFDFPYSSFIIRNYFRNTFLEFARKFQIPYQIHLIETFGIPKIYFTYFTDKQRNIIIPDFLAGSS